MMPILATDYGNFEAYLIGIPALLIALVMGIVGAIMRERFSQIVAGTGCLVLSGIFYGSLSEAKAADKDLTVCVSAVCLALGLLFISASFLRRKKR